MAVKSICKLGLTVLSLMLTLSGPAEAQTETVLGKPLRGTDDRVMIDSGKHPYPAIGRLNLGSGRQFCSGTLIAPNKVLTATHCLVDRRTKKVFRPSQIHFVAGQRRAAYADASRASCIVPLKRKAENGEPDYTRFADDVTVVFLERPLRTTAAPVAAPYIGDPGPLTHTAYSRSRPFLPSEHRDCKLLHKTKGIWLTSCDTELGSSGGPVFAYNGTELQVIAVMSGVVKAEGKVYSIAVPVTQWHRLAGSAACGG